MKFILGNKLEMTQKFLNDGTVIPVTKVQVGNCVVTQIKNETKDGYKSAQIGFGSKKKLNKSLAGHLKGFDNFRYLKEFFLEKDEKLEKGDKIDISTFVVGDVVKVTGVSKGKGFQGVVKRHGFKGGPASHGHKDQLRMPGSIGATGPAHVFKGTRMAGRMGGDQVTVKNLEIIEIDLDNNLLFIKGALPGYRGSLIKIIGEGELRVDKKERHENQSLETKDLPAQSADKDETIKKEINNSVPLKDFSSDLEQGDKKEVK